MHAVLIEVDVTGIEREADSRVYASKSCPHQPALRISVRHVAHRQREQQRPLADRVGHRGERAGHGRTLLSAPGENWGLGERAGLRLG